LASLLLRHVAIGVLPSFPTRRSSDLAMPDAEPARKAGRQALSSLRAGLAQRVANLLQRDPELLGEAVEVGLVRKEWLEDPAGERSEEHTSELQSHLNLVCRRLIEKTY